MRPTHRILVAAVCAVAVTALGGCSAYNSVASYIGSDKAELCPDAAILATTASLPAFDAKAGPADPSSILYTANLTFVSTRCDLDKKEHRADARLKVYYEATRSPGGGEATYKVPYFVAISNEGNISAKKLYWLTITFENGAISTKGEDTVDSTVVKAAKGKEPAEYRLVVGFQLTQAQLDYNKKIGQYVQ
ncbi:MAG: hypothetical protein KGJ78_05575 [Alphaproteobacteria bacterium]|nr:hypothetical protein [Alphaproteobacteria bacterium]